MTYVLICLAAILGLGLLFRSLTLISKWLNRPTVAEVADVIDKHAQGTEGPWDWDDFTSVPIRDDRLDAIRLQCLELDHAPPERRLRELKAIVERLRNQAA